MKIADVIIPVYNECENLPLLWQRLQALTICHQLHFIFVDNASTDGSAEYLAALPNITLIRHAKNRGYGASLRSGMQAAQTECWIILDADGEYPPECIPDLLQALVAQPAVYASRLAGKSFSAAGMPFLQCLGNVIISALYNALFQQQVSDLYTGCKALRRECMDGIRLQRDGFEQVLELAVALAQRGIKIAEIPVAFAPRQHGVSKMSHITETAKYFFWLLRYRFVRLENSAAKGCKRG
jgi:glycosyltransferase involved in cell wall biosynthesis